MSSISSSQSDSANSRDEGYLGGDETSPKRPELILDSFIRSYYRVTTIRAEASQRDKMKRLLDQSLDQARLLKEVVAGNSVVSKDSILARSTMRHLTAAVETLEKHLRELTL